MAGFEGVKWADKQMLYLLKDKSFTMLAPDAKVYAVSRSIHYGLYLVFEGIRFACNRDSDGGLQVVFLNLHKNMERFRKGIAFSLSSAQQALVPSQDELFDIFTRYLKSPEMKPFLSEMAESGAQGYLRPFTVDEQQSIGVTYPENPSIRAVTCRYDSYLGEPFTGVVIPHIVRATEANGTGCLKLGTNYVMSVKAVDEARRIMPGAAAALFLDDRTHDPIETRRITEWDSSCCLFAMRDGRIIKIPENPLILPSVTIQGICTILKQSGVEVEERHVTYGEVLEKSKNNELVTVCSVGTAGVLNRADKLLLVDENCRTIGVHNPDKSHHLYTLLGETRKIYWNVYKGNAPVPDGINVYTFAV